MKSHQQSRKMFFDDKKKVRALNVMQRECEAKKSEKGHPWDSSEFYDHVFPALESNKNEWSEAKQESSRVSLHPLPRLLMPLDTAPVVKAAEEKNSWSWEHTKSKKIKRKKRNNIKRIRKPFFEGYITQSLRIVHTSGVSWGEEDCTDARLRSLLGIVLSFKWQLMSFNKFLANKKTISGLNVIKCFQANKRRLWIGTTMNRGRFFAQFLR